jgi:hypothetical protein
MKRTTVMFPADLKLKAEREAKRQGISFGHYVRLCLEKEIIAKKTPRRRFFPNFDFTFIDDGPADLSANLDKYLDKWDEEDEQRTKTARSRPGRKKIRA